MTHIRNHFTKVYLEAVYRASMKEHEIYMNRALELAKIGEKTVSPNPMVGCVIVQEHKIIGEGYHFAPGRPHAEIHALQAAGEAAKGASVYVTLEPCSHHGRTPPCTDALIAAGVKQVIVAMRDPNPQVNGSGLTQLRQAGISVTEKVLEKEARDLNVRYLTRIEKKRPWVIAKWAMTLDGKIASRTGSSQWISSESSRHITHQLRGQMDAILVGSRTANQDDPSLTVRVFEKYDENNAHTSHTNARNASPAFSPTRRWTDPTDPRVPLRIILDSSASLSMESRLVSTAHEIPVLIGVDAEAPIEKINALKNAGCEVIVLPGRVRRKDVHQEERKRSRDFRPGSQELRANFRPENPEEEDARRELEGFKVYRERFVYLFADLAKRGITNLLVEGGGIVLGSLFDARMIDEVHVFIAPKLIGGEKAAAAIGGIGLAEMNDAFEIETPICRFLWPDIYVHGRVKYTMV